MVTQSSKTIKNIINNKNNNTHIKYDAGVFSVVCLDCTKRRKWNIMIDPKTNLWI